MVESIFIHKVLKGLEKYLIKRNNYRLLGDNYDLILLVPSDKYSSDSRYSLVVSAKKLDNLSQREVIKELLIDLKDLLESDEYNLVSRLNILHSEDPFVRNLKTISFQREEILEINGVTIGGVMIDFAQIAKSLLLDNLVEGKTVRLVIDAKGLNFSYATVGIIAGIIRIDENFDIVYYTEKGLYEMHRFEMFMTDDEKSNAEKLKKEPEECLIKSGHIAKFALDNIISATPYSL